MTLKTYNTSCLEFIHFLKLYKNLKTNQMKIRIAKEKDLFRIEEMTKALTIHLGAFEWTVDNHLKHIKHRFMDERYIHIVAEDTNEIVGFTGAELISKRTAYMLKGNVEPCHRKKGVMRLMEGKLIKLLQEKGVKRIDLKVDPNNNEGLKT